MPEDILDRYPLLYESHRFGESKVITIPLAYGDFRFVILEPTKALYATGEQVYIHYKVKNQGTGTVSGKIEVFDDATKELICTWTIPATGPGEAFEVMEATDYMPPALVMPDHDWKLLFQLTP